jgi:hypothetical protein
MQERLIDANALYKQVAEEAAFRIKQAWRGTEIAEARGMSETLKYIDNAPTVEPNCGASMVDSRNFMPNITVGYKER